MLLNPERNTNVRDLVGKQLQAFEDNIAGLGLANGGGNAAVMPMYEFTYATSALAPTVATSSTRTSGTWAAIDRATQHNALVIAAGAGYLASAWIGVGRANPSSRMAFRRAGCSLSDEKGIRPS